MNVVYIQTVLISDCAQPSLSPLPSASPHLNLGSICFLLHPFYYLPPLPLSFSPYVPYPVSSRLPYHWALALSPGRFALSRLVSVQYLEFLWMTGSFAFGCDLKLKPKLLLRDLKKKGNFYVHGYESYFITGS